MNACVELDRIRLRAGTRVLADDLSLRIGAGQIWCVAGPNGAGKTTLIDVVAGLRAPAAGRIVVDGAPLAQWQAEPLARRRALMPQATHDAFGATVLETVLIGRYPWLGGWGWERDADREIARDALHALDIDALAQRDITTLSGGERQRVALAAALCQQAPLLLLDEPLAHLDLRHQIDCLRVLERWVADAREQRTVIFSCHDLNLARTFATHAMLFDGAGAVVCGPVRDVLTPEHASRAFGFPLVLLGDGERDMLVPHLGTPTPTPTSTPASTPTPAPRE
ncbi:ABC transporter ATP-binding protein [Pararobbsia silviterrae]|uniref:ABC transporter ATP-binding protein n=1 Tax=Pararobbsia silviterrae TaxID=1792498 RepID=A0A494Y3V1_9BURK|nr:ABC transporter ATP-binding protein [Pararobbsia silviterrae]RKP56698.1 ABC transporter ATP-binding protein [Pararobbsia silviterrae]